MVKTVHISLEKEDYYVIGMIAFMVLFIGLVVLAFIINFQIGAKKDEVIKGEGVIDDMRIETTGTLLNVRTKYIISINNKDYEINEDSYNEIEVGDYVRIYESGRVEVVE